MVNFCKSCDVHVFFVEEMIEALSSIPKGAKNERLSGYLNEMFGQY